MQNHFVLNSQTLECFINNMPQPAYINSVETGEYLYGNLVSQEFLNTHSSNKKLSQSWIQADNSKDLKEKYVFFEEEMDDELLKTGDVITHKNCIELDDDGKICFYTIVKIPVIGEQQKIVAILTMRFKSEHVVQPVELYQIYKVTTKNKKSAIEKTMYHLDLEKYFLESLTEKELICLLNMKIDASHKYLMSKLFVSKKTIESHISSLIKKSKSQHLSEVLAHLRSLIV